MDQAGQPRLARTRLAREQQRRLLGGDAAKQLHSLGEFRVEDTKTRLRGILSGAVACGAAARRARRARCACETACRPCEGADERRQPGLIAREEKKLGEASPQQGFRLDALVPEKDECRSR